jgi:DNA topoisomerase IB
MLGPAYGAENRGRVLPTRGRTAPGLQSAMSSDVSSRSPFHRRGPMYGFVRLRTDIFRPLGETPRDASNTATIRAFVKSARAPNMNMWSRLRWRRCRQFEPKSASTWRFEGSRAKRYLPPVVHLLQTTLIRVGNDEYAKQNKSYGLTTLKTRHVAVDGNEVRFRFTGKSGKQWSLRVRDRRIAKIIRACQELPGQELLQYLDEDGKPQDVTSSDVNAYLKEITGNDITAKDFRTWAGTVLAAMVLNEVKTFDSAAQAKRNLRTAIENVAARLGNTPTICRKCYVHPDVLTSYLDGNLVLEIKKAVEDELRDELSGLQPEEAAVLAMLRGRLTKEAGERDERARAA